MDFSKLIEQRYSVRAYRATPVEEDKLQRVLDAACLAPTAANRQPFQLIVVHTEGKKADLKRIYPAEWFCAAPVVVGICTLPGQAWKRKDGKCYADVDAAIVMDHLILAATEQGLGTCWIGAFDPGAAREVLGLPTEAEPLAFTPLGYAADQARPKQRKPLAALVRWERW